VPISCFLHIPPNAICLKIHDSHTAKGLVYPNRPLDTRLFIGRACKPLPLSQDKMGVKLDRFGNTSQRLVNL